MLLAIQWQLCLCCQGWLEATCGILQTSLRRMCLDLQGQVVGTVTTVNVQDLDWYMTGKLESRPGLRLTRPVPRLSKPCQSSKTLSICQSLRNQRSVVLDHPFSHAQHFAACQDRRWDRRYVRVWTGSRRRGSNAVTVQARSICQVPGFVQHCFSHWILIAAACSSIARLAYG